MTRSTRTKSAALAAALLMVASSAAAQSFEGTIKQRTVVISPEAVASLVGGSTGLPSPDRVFSLPTDQVLARAANAGGEPPVTVVTTWHIRGRKARMDIELSGAPAGTLAPGLTSLYALVDEQEGTAMLVIPAMRAYMSTSLEAMEGLLQLASPGQIGAPGARQPEPVIRNLGRGTINGIAAEGTELRIGDDLVARTWSSPEYQNVLPLVAAATARLPLGDPSAALNGGLPVRIQSLMRASGSPIASGDGYAYVVMELLEINRGTVADSLLAAPQGFMRMDMPGLQ